MAQEETKYELFDEDKNYCGPGPLTVYASGAANEACYVHDNQYSDQKEFSPYFNYFEADRQFLNTKKPGLAGWLANQVFRVKQNVMPARGHKAREVKFNDRMKKQYAQRLLEERRKERENQGSGLRKRRMKHTTGSSQKMVAWLPYRRTTVQPRFIYKHGKKIRRRW